MIVIIGTTRGFASMSNLQPSWLRATRDPVLGHRIDRLSIVLGDERPGNRGAMRARQDLDRENLVDPGGKLERGGQLAGGQLDDRDSALE